MPRSRLCLAVLLGCLAAPAVSHAATPREVVADLAANQTHSWRQDGIGFDAMVTRYQAGERLYVTCGNVAEVGRRLLRAEGVPARVVQVITDGAFDYFNDGHLMLEVWEEDRWQLYDPDANVRAVNADGEGINLVEQVEAVQAGTALWEAIATDPLYLEDEPDPVLRDLAARIFSDPAAFYQRVMGTPLIPRDPAGSVMLGMYFHDAEQRDRLAAYKHGWRFFANAVTWESLLTTTDVPPLPAPTPVPTPTPTPTPPAPAPAPAPAPVSPPATPAPVVAPAVPATAAVVRSVKRFVFQRRGRRAVRVTYRPGSRRHSPGAPAGWFVAPEQGRAGNRRYVAKAKRRAR